MRLTKFFPFLRWFPVKPDLLKSDIIAGITVAMILVPQSMAYANLAGLPVVYGLYASFLPVIIASMWGASKFLHTGPVAMLSLMSAAAIEPLATRGSDEFMQIAFLLAFMVGCLRLILGVFRLGVIMNLTSSPVIVGFTNAAALIIGLSLLNSFLGVPMPRSDNFLQDLSQVVQLTPHAHIPTLLFAVGTVIFLLVFSKYFQKLPAVLLAVTLGISISYLTGFEDKIQAAPEQIVDEQATGVYAKLHAAQQNLLAIKSKQQTLRSQQENLTGDSPEAMTLKANSLLLEGEEKRAKYEIYQFKIQAHKKALIQTERDGKIVYTAAEGNSMLQHVYRLDGFRDGQYILSGGGSVVGEIPSGLPSMSIPQFDLGLMSTLFFSAFVIALIGFMEATSISRVLATKSREKLNPNQELIGQGLANIVGSFFQSYVVSGSFSRSAVAAKVGAQTGMYAIISALGVVLVILFLTEYLYHLPKAILAAIVMTAVFGLIDIKPMIQAWKVNHADGIAGAVTFIATLLLAPQLADGVLIGIGLTILLYLIGNMNPRSEIMGLKPNGSLGGAATHDLPPVSKHFVTVRFDASLVFVNVAHFEYAIMDAISYYPNTKGILIICNGINRIDASGEAKLRTLIDELKQENISLYLAGLKKEFTHSLEESGLDNIIGQENMFASTRTAVETLKASYEP
ncbi:MAG: Sulfate permease [uncultured Thiotrichaceae bacterium]|uniref:Sulfate permease n=1 Tax=uncultured Thiotrichaceae bacterium TaxID=298394 RepID=A0A6S6U3Z4_9GAMM|nr:MAG: Sulfate permease [uncultured Thiotrichaceae bacterium]